MIAPASWQGAEELRACYICSHGRTSAGEPSRGRRERATHCACPDVAGGRGPIAIAQARALHGPCGPEALHQEFPGLREAPPLRRAFHAHASAH